MTISFGFHNIAVGRVLELRFFDILSELGELGGKEPGFRKEVIVFWKLLSHLGEAET